MNSPRRHWLDEPKNIKLLWRVFLVVLLASVLAELVVEMHPAFAVDRWFGFSAAYGFVACALMILGAKALGTLIKRPDSYYHAEDERDD